MLNNHFEVPADRIAQAPNPVRDHCRLLIHYRSDNKIIHTVFKNLPDYFEHGDVLVLNHSKVRPARVEAKKVTGGRLEILFLEPLGKQEWKILIKPFLAPGTEIILPNNRNAKISSRAADGEMILACRDTNPVTLMEKYGIAPLPPYIKRARSNSPRPNDRKWYQTVYARKPGSVAAPTAGLHFTRTLLNRLSKKGVDIVYLTHHIGWGTFKPIRAEDPRNHRMLPESFDLGAETAARINKARSSGRRVIGVGTSVVRALESCFTPGVGVEPRRGKTDLYICPPRRVGSIDGLITNFHLPHSTPLMLIDAVIGPQARSDIYSEALSNGYRFYSYGDAMLTLP